MLLLQPLAKDDQGGIRTNATVCMVKLSGYFTSSVRRGPLLNSFLRSTRDPSVPARQAGIAALAATQSGQ
ncbi:unnamed protein product [Protopolystoma xenopodis]|uniref:Condensin complex subunit 1 C-terminal domain-containing protein n=1 Tax=Protopolystoma xenopodis TaxID=117903 RepID=A0A448XNC3_9PLAT|nr:unnamed protein product [Protopolystoma xenopodis]